jgi:chromosome segregation ATPase
MLIFRDKGEDSPVIQKLQGQIQVLKDERETIEQRGFTYFSKLNSNVSQLEKNMEHKIDEMYYNMKNLDNQVKELNLDLESLKNENKSLRVSFI